MVAIEAKNCTVYTQYVSTLVVNLQADAVHGQKTDCL